MAADLGQHETQVGRVADDDEDIELEQREEDGFLMRCAQEERRDVGAKSEGRRRAIARMLSSTK